MVSQHKIIDQVEIDGRVTPNHFQKNEKKKKKSGRITYILLKIYFENVSNNSDSSKSEPIYIIYIHIYNI